jgi:hypothetical protein
MLCCIICSTTKGYHKSLCIYMAPKISNNDDEILQILSEISKISEDMKKLHLEKNNEEHLQLIAFCFALLSLILCIKTGGINRLMFADTRSTYFNGYDLLAISYLPHLLFAFSYN